MLPQFVLNNPPDNIYISFLVHGLMSVIHQTFTRTNDYAVYGHIDALSSIIIEHDDVIRWNHFPRYWPFVRELTGRRWNPLTKASDAELWCFLICAWKKHWVNNRDAGDMRRHRAHYVSKKGTRFRSIKDDINESPLRYKGVPAWQGLRQYSHPNQPLTYHPFLTHSVTTPYRYFRLASVYRPRISSMMVSRGHYRYKKTIKCHGLLMHTVASCDNGMVALCAINERGRDLVTYG